MTDIQIAQSCKMEDISAIASFESFEDFLAADTSRLIADKSKNNVITPRIIRFIIYPSKLLYSYFIIKES